MAEDWLFPFDREQVEVYAKLGWWPPGYPAFLSLIYRIAESDDRAAVWVQVLLGGLVCALVHRLGRRAGGAATARWAALFIALNPTYVFLTNILAAENLFVVWLAFGMWFAGREWTRARIPLVAGILFGLGAMTRAVGLAVPVMAAWALRGGTAMAPQVWRRGALAMLIGAAAIIAPWTVRNYVLTGTPALVCFGGGLNFYFGHNPVAVGYRDVAQTPMARLTTQAAVDREGYRLGFAYLAEAPFGFVSRAVTKIIALGGSPGYAPHASSALLLPENWQTDPEQGRIAAAMRARQRAKNVWLDGLFTHWAAVHSWLLMAGGLVACMTAWRRLPPDLRLGAWLIVYWIAAHVVFWGQPRFRYPMEIPLALLTAYALTHRTWRRPTAPSANRNRR
jgi:4-amino-4-deoxy-L-arabinose transferase-like glycosyltransferase